MIYGEYSYEDGSVYRGQWNKDGRRHGVGRLLLTDGSLFVGEFVNGVNSGLGVMHADDFTFQGQFKQGEMHGLGRVRRSDGLTFEGQFVRGEIQGPGLVTFPDGSHGTPANEGQFHGHRMVRRCGAREVVAKARVVADAAASISIH